MELQVFGLKLKRKIEETDWAVRETYISKKMKWDTNKISKYEFKAASISDATHFSISTEPPYFDKQDGISRVKGEYVHSAEIPEIPTGGSDLLPLTGYDLLNWVERQVFDIQLLETIKAKFQYIEID